MASGDGNKIAFITGITGQVSFICIWFEDNLEYSFQANFPIHQFSKQDVNIQTPVVIMVLDT